MVCTRGCWDAKHNSNHDFWHQFERGNEWYNGIMCDVLASSEPSTIERTMAITDVLEQLRKGRSACVKSSYASTPNAYTSLAAVNRLVTMASGAVQRIGIGLFDEEGM